MRYKPPPGVAVTQGRRTGVPGLGDPFALHAKRVQKDLKQV